MAPNLAGGWTPPLPVDYRHRVTDIRYNRARNLYAEDEKDLRLEYRFWHPSIMISMIPFFIKSF